MHHQEKLFLKWNYYYFKKQVIFWHRQRWTNEKYTQRCWTQCVSRLDSKIMIKMLKIPAEILVSTIYRLERYDSCLLVSFNYAIHLMQISHVELNLGFAKCFLSSLFFCAGICPIHPPLKLTLDYTLLSYLVPCCADGTLRDRERIIVDQITTNIARSQ